jgi:hypothetical protein
MTEMTEKDSGPGAAKIRKGMPAARSPVCYQTQRDIVIPAGTILRHIGGDEFCAAIGNAAVELVLAAPAGMPIPAEFKRVIA